jgi:hypothetical protein
MLKKPDWHYWRNMPRAELWQAIAISMDICPKQSMAHASYNQFRETISVYSTSGTLPPLSDRYRDEQDRMLRPFQDRLDVAEAHMREGILEFDSSLQAAAYDRVKLPTFAAWAIDRGWKIPPELEKRALPLPGGDTATSPKQEGARADDEPHPRTRNNYLRLIYSLALLVPKFDAKHPRTAANLIKDVAHVAMDEKTLAGFISDAYELNRQEFDR